MEAFTNNTQVLYSRVKNVIYELAEEKPFGTPLTHGEVIVALEAIIKQFFITIFQRLQQTRNLSLDSEILLRKRN